MESEDEGMIFLERDTDFDLLNLSLLIPEDYESSDDENFKFHWKSFEKEAFPKGPILAHENVARKTYATPKKTAEMAKKYNWVPVVDGAKLNPSS